VAAGPVADATWNATPISGDFNTAANWTPAFVPTATAFFGTSTITSLSLSASATLGGFTLNAGAPAYSLLDNGQFLTFNGAGIVIDGGSLAITNNGTVVFSNAGTAGSATITNGGIDRLAFDSNSTAASATITSNYEIVFAENSTAGNATITNGGVGMVFGNASTGGNAAITNGNAAIIDFSFSAGPNNDRKLSAGSIAGGGTLYLGGDQLTVGGNNLSTVVSGVISDCGAGATFAVPLSLAADPPPADRWSRSVPAR
jgi:hypothetical protein